MSFLDSIALLDYTPRTLLGNGFLPPIVRTMGHILYLLGCLADEAVTVTDTDALSELQHAQDHFHARANASEAVSTVALTYATNLEASLADARTEYIGWSHEDRLTNLRALAHRIVAFAALLDRELVGLTGSDPGSSL